MLGALRRLVVVGASASAIAAVALVALPSSSAFAYGRADQPLAQVEVSANCNNAGFPLCAPDSVGTGGIWYWVELDANYTGDLAGAACGHTIGGVKGPGGAGAISINGPVSWSYSSLEDAPPDVNFFGAFDPNDEYYLVTITDGSQWLFPVTTGHYGTNLAPGVQLQITVAP